MCFLLQICILAGIALALTHPNHSRHGRQTTWNVDNRGGGKIAGENFYESGSTHSTDNSKTTNWTVDNKNGGKIGGENYNEGNGK